MKTTEPDDVKGKTRKLFIAAFIFALLAGLGTMLYLNILERRLKAKLTPPRKEMVHVIVASRDLPSGSVINTSTMSVRAVPKAFVNSDVFTPDKFDSIKGAILVKPLQHGKMLAQDYIDLKIAKDFSGTIQTGHRAVTIQVDELNSISGMIRPGNSIDLFTRMASGALPSSGRSDEGEVVIPVLVDVLVLATDKISARPNEDEFKNMTNRERGRTYNTLTLEVTPKEAALIAIAESRGELIAALRNSIDTGGILFNEIGISDLITHSGVMLDAAISKEHNRELSGIHLNSHGQLVTRDGIVIKTPGVHLDKNGLLVSKNGTILSGRNLIVGDDGRIRTRSGKLVDPATLVAGKNGTLVDGDGTVLPSNGYATTKGGFIVDKNGNVMTRNGDILKGLTVGKDGQVRTKDGTVVTADQIRIGKDGKVRLLSPSSTPMHLDQDGVLRTADGKSVQAGDLVRVGKNGVVYAKNGRILKGVTVGKDGALYDANGKKMTPTDVILAGSGFTKIPDGKVTDATGHIYTAKDLVTIGKDGIVRTKDGRILTGAHLDKDGNLRDKNGKLLTAADIIEKNGVALANAANDKKAGDGFSRNPDGTVTDAAGNVYTAKDLVSVDKDGTVRTKDGQILAGIHMDKDGTLRDKNGKLLTAADILKREDKAKENLIATSDAGRILAGVTATHTPDFISSIGKKKQEALQEYTPYKVEYIIGGQSKGPATTFTVQIEKQPSVPMQNK